MLLTTETYKPIRPTTVHEAILACATVSVEDDGCNNDPTAHLESLRDTLTDLFDDSGKFVPESQWNCFTRDRMRS